MGKFTIKKFQHFEGREATSYERPKRNLSEFTDEELEIVRDLFLTYVDTFDMVPMPSDDVDMDSKDIFYYIQSYRNIGIDISSRLNIRHVYDTIMLDIEKRLDSFGFYLYHHDLYTSGGVNKIDMTIMKKDEDSSRNVKSIYNR